MINCGKDWRTTEGKTEKKKVIFNPSQSVTKINDHHLHRSRRNGEKKEEKEAKKRQRKRRGRKRLSFFDSEKRAG